MRRPASAEQGRRVRGSDAPSLLVRPSLPRSRQEGPAPRSEWCRSKEDSHKRPTPASMAGGSLLQQLQEALAAEKHSKTEAVEAVEREMQAQLELAEVHRTHALEQQETFWTSELASERESKEITVGGLEDEIASLKLQVEDWRRLEVTENMMKDEAEASVLSLQLLCGEQRVQLHQLRNEADVAANAERVISRLEMSQEEGERHRKEAFDLRVTVAALNERCKRQEEALARRTQSARSNLPRPPIAGRREGALRGLARESEQAHLKTVEEDGNLPESWSMSEASRMACKDSMLRSCKITIDHL
eukprot:symbB.v1.2.010257.t1/scaffold670.1/size174347/8